ncbi:hypothetical protein GJ744_004625 [Endocarpon pusillum]|uniref:Uncharacterized protein n=1 Tax=Endocarpon pusillum TaxID=364733 RepID=A0A8H7E980_9EURO|nr:hypothetical protein GJ744_004625 [Endocarpon pusillum]
MSITPSTSEKPTVIRAHSLHPPSPRNMDPYPSFCLLRHYIVQARAMSTITRKKVEDGPRL